ncbi:amino acid decarboxylase [Ornithinibacillus halophilus]|uniref:TusA-related sulfurtransferase n=1 Tax=Ornithinibacillus halophilus TaxID=930117 RepID=A0A1M5NW96_9BACI|nr:amino acid decarboxylase [Ornithinibacillus halophilus]SHG93748.1 hypothetical protein SAMN05216225_10914 [Ornithinibacillus halophilus]
MQGARKEGNKAIIDVRERILNGEHPRNEIFDYVKEAPVGTIFEIHLPRRGQPIITGLESFGMNVIVDDMGPGHFRLTSVKLAEINASQTAESSNTKC